MAGTSPSLCGMEEDPFDMANAGPEWARVGQDGAQRMVFDDYMYDENEFDDEDDGSGEGWGVNVLSCVQQLADPELRFTALIVLDGNEYAADDIATLECWGPFCSNLSSVLEDPREGVRTAAAGIITNVVEALKNVTTTQGLELLRILARDLATMPQVAEATGVMRPYAGVMAQFVEVLPRTADAAECMPQTARVMPRTAEAAGVMPQTAAVMPQLAGVMPQTAGLMPHYADGPGAPLTANPDASGLWEGESARTDKGSALVPATLALLELLPSVWSTWRAADYSVAAKIVAGLLSPQAPHVLIRLCQGEPRGMRWWQKWVNPQNMRLILPSHLAATGGLQRLLQMVVSASEGSVRYPPDTVQFAIRATGDVLSFASGQAELRRGPPTAEGPGDVEATSADRDPTPACKSMKEKQKALHGLKADPSASLGEGQRDPAATVDAAEATSALVRIATAPFIGLSLPVEFVQRAVQAIARLASVHTAEHPTLLVEHVWLMWHPLVELALTGAKDGKETSPFLDQSTTLTSTAQETLAAIGRCLVTLANTEAGRELIKTPLPASYNAGDTLISEFSTACSAAAAVCTDESSRNALADYAMLASM